MKTKKRVLTKVLATEILETKIQHQVQFIPADGIERPQKAEPVRAKVVKDLEYIPDWAGKIIFQDVVQSRVRSNGVEQVLSTNPVSQETYFVRRASEASEALRRLPMKDNPVAVPHRYKGHLLVFRH